MDKDCPQRIIFLFSSLTNFVIVYFWLNTPKLIDDWVTDIQCFVESDFLYI